MKTKTTIILPRGVRGGRRNRFAVTYRTYKSRSNTRGVLKLLGVVLLMIVLLLVFDITS